MITKCKNFFKPYFYAEIYNLILWALHDRKAMFVIKL